MMAEKKAKNIKADNEIMPKKKGNRNRNWNRTLILGVVAVTLLAGIAYAVLSGGSTQKTIDNQIQLPSYAYTNPVTLDAYKYATQHPDLLEQIPCYCGCGGHSGHRFLRDCFIHDDWTYDEHASFCDVCVGEAIKVQDYLSSGKTLKEARALIDEEYTQKGGDRTNTPPVSDYYTPILTPRLSGISATVSTPKQVDLSGFNLPDNFKSIADGLKLTPVGANRAYFINTKLVRGTEMETEEYSSQVEPSGFYNKPLMGMYSADYSATSWIELHDLGYDNTNDTTIRSHAEQGMKNIVYTRPLVYGHIQNVDNVLKLMKDPASMDTSYKTYKPLLDAVDYENSAYALVMKLSNKFSDMSYTGINPGNGKIELVQAYNLTDSNSIPVALNKYNPEIKGNILIIKVAGDMATINKEKDNIDAAAK
jgi:hypothetical protein